MKLHNCSDIATIVPPALYILQPRPPLRLGRWAITVGCLYELVALWSRLPTITDLVTRPRRHPVGWVVAGCWMAVWSAHFRPRRLVVVA